MDETIYFYLPNFVEFVDLNLALMIRVKEHPDHYRDNLKIGAVYGVFPGQIWNGGRHSIGTSGYEDIMKYIELYDNLDIPIRFTYTNPLITGNLVYDRYCNFITKQAETGKNEILANTNELENYLRKEYPKYKFISSTTKRITDIDALNEELEKDYKLVVIDYDFNNQWEVLDKIKHPEKCEVLINPVCNPNCPLRKQHYERIGKAQLEFGGIMDPKIDTCPAQSRGIHDVMKLPTYVSWDNIEKNYIPKGFRHFKFEGRTFPQERMMDWYILYLVKDEYKEEERHWLTNAIIDGVMIERK